MKYCNGVWKRHIGQHLASTAIRLNVIRYGFNRFTTFDVPGLVINVPRNRITMMPEHLRGTIAAARCLLQCALEYRLIIIDIRW